MSVVVSCVTVAGDPGAETISSARSSTSVAPSPGATLEPSATVPSTPRPTLRPTPTVPLEPSPDPTTEPTPEPTAEPTPEPTPRAIELSEPVTVVTPLTISGDATPTPDAAGTSAAGREQGTVALDATTSKRLQRVLRRTVKKDRVVGLQAAVRLPSGETWIGTAGRAELQPQRWVSADTQFAIASITKTFIAALILQLAEEGKVDLDAPFGTYFTDAPRSKKVTLRQLLSHTSGIHNFWENRRYLNVISRAWWESPDATGLQARDHRWSYDEMMGLVQGGYFKPGKDYHYSNTNYLILGKVAEAVEGKPLARQLRERFFEPLGLDRTVYQPAQKPDTDAAHGHWATESGYMDHTREASVVPFMAAVTVADAAGAMASTAEDLATWADALYGGKVLSRASLRQMTTFLRPGLYGLGTDVAVFAGHRGHGHRGGIRGYESSMWHFPDSGVSIVLLSNRGNWVTDTPMLKLVKAVLGSS